jgi:hypothetical protein
MVTPLIDLDTDLLDLTEERLQLLEEQAWRALYPDGDADRPSFVVGYRTGLLAVLGALRERLIHGI